MILTFSLAYFENIIYNTCNIKICICQLFMFLLRLSVNGRLLSFRGVKLCRDFPLEYGEVGAPNPGMFRDQPYYNFK